MENKLVSVCINSYNSEKYIVETINSVINQTYKNLQIIVIDDCSTDNTVQLIKSIKDDRIEFYSTKKNRHISFAYNESFKYVKGDYIARIDADDLWEKDKIEKQVKFLEENQQYGACFTHVSVIDGNGNSDSKDLQSLREVFDFNNCSHAEMYRFFYEHSNRLCNSSSIIRTNIRELVGNYDVSIFNVNDFDYWMRLITYCPIYIMTEPLTRYRSGGVSSDNSGSKWVAHNTELVRVIYKSINMCPDELFLDAFSDKLRLAGKHTHEETEIEKAILLLEGPLTYKGNPVLGIYKFSELFKEEKYIILAESKFNFTIKDLYKIQGSPSYFNVGDNNHLVNSLAKVTCELKKERKTILDAYAELKRYKTYINDLESARNSQNLHIKNLEEYIIGLEEQKRILDRITSSFYWRVTSPLRALSSTIKKFLNVQKK